MERNGRCRRSAQHTFRAARRRCANRSGALGPFEESHQFTAVSLVHEVHRNPLRARLPAGPGAVAGSIRTRPGWCGGTGMDRDLRERWPAASADRRSPHFPSASRGSLRTVQSWRLDAGPRRLPSCMGRGAGRGRGSGARRRLFLRPPLQARRPGAGTATGLLTHFAELTHVSIAKRLRIRRRPST